MSLSPLTLIPGLTQIPLRQLVYRVLDLPPSMRPLVYDFGQLSTGAESDYIKQIVNDHVCSTIRFIPCYNVMPLLCMVVFLV